LSSLLGLLCLIGSCYFVSENRRNIKWQTIIVGTLLQIVFALICLKTTTGREFFQSVQTFFEKISQYSLEGARFVFGDLADVKKSGFVFAIHVFSTIIFCSALMALLYYFGMMQKVIKYMSLVMMKLMRVSGSESLGATANIFLGQTESCLAIKPYVAGMTRSEVFSLMVTGLSTVATSVVGAYIGMGLDPIHILTASFISAPAGVVCAKLLIPELDESETATSFKINEEQVYANPIDALIQGGREGLFLCLEIASSLIVFVAIVPLLDSGLHLIGSHNMLYVDLLISRLWL
jgi:CNT family concentrative nucleoside transporter